MEDTDNFGFFDTRKLSAAIHAELGLRKVSSTNGTYESTCGNAEKVELEKKLYRVAIATASMTLSCMIDADDREGLYNSLYSAMSDALGKCNDTVCDFCNATMTEEDPQTNFPCSICGYLSDCCRLCAEAHLIGDMVRKCSSEFDLTPCGIASAKAQPLPQ